MNELLTVRATAFTTGLLSVVLCICMVYVALTRKTYPGFYQWTVSYICLGVGMVLMSLRYLIPDWASIVVANLLFVCHFSLICRGLSRFLNAPENTWITLGLPLVVLVVFPYFTLIAPELLPRVLIIYGTVAVLCYRGAWLALRHGKPAMGSVNWLLTTSLTVLALYVTLHGAYIATVGLHGQDYMAQDWLSSLSLLMAGLNNVAVMAALISMNSQRLEMELTQARDEVKTLKGFLPICARCKKIRDDDGYWNRLETYLHQHTDAKLTHGICPECAAELYPDIKVNLDAGAMAE